MRSSPWGDDRCRICDAILLQYLIDCGIVVVNDMGPGGIRLRIATEGWFNNGRFFSTANLILDRAFVEQTCAYGCKVWGARAATAG